MSLNMSNNKKQQICLFNNELTQGKIIFFSWDTQNNWQVLSVSASVEPILGYSVEDFKSGKTVYAELIHPDDIERVKQEVEHASEQNLDEFTHELYRIKDAFGAYRYVYDHTKIIRNQDNEVIEFHGYISDETKITEQQSRYELVLESAKIGLWDWNPQTNEVFYDERWAEMLGYQYSEIQQNINSWQIKVHPEDLNACYNDIRAHIKGETQYYENVHRIHHKSGKWLYILDRGQIVERDAEGKPTRITGTHMDITPLKEAQAQLEVKTKHHAEISQRYKTMLQLSSEAVFILDIRGNLLEYSDIAKRFLGYDTEQMRKLTIYHWDQGLEKNEFYELMKDVQEEENIHFERIHTRKDNSTFYASVNARVIDIYGFKTVHCSVRDITKEKKLEQDTLKAKEKAVNALQAKSEFLANMSHEIRTPLNAILGFINLLKQQKNDLESQEFIDIIDSSSHTLLNIIDDILDLSKIESNNLELTPVDFILKDEIEKMLKLFEASAREHNIELTLDIASPIPNAINTDLLRLRQIISNLLSNAIKFSDQNKTVMLKVSYQAPLLTIEVIDQGIGISEAGQRKIFEAFAQAESSTTRKYGGTGLGLTISSKLVRLLKGKLQVSSKLNQGSQFFFSIPVEETQFDKKPEVETVTGPIDYVGRVLLVEDNKTNQLLMGSIFKKLNVTFDVANDGLEAVHAFHQNHYALILMDENMPNLSGTEATKQIREKELKLRTHIPIVALTANSMPGDKERFLKAGMNDYLCKPLNIEELKQKLATYLCDSSQLN